MHTGRWRRAVVAISAVAALGLSAFGLSARQPSPLLPNPNGPRRPDVNHVALVNATVIPEPGKRLEHATVVMKDGRITHVLVPDAAAMTPAGERPAAPPPPDVPGARIIDCTGLYIYAGFIEPFAEVDAPKPPADAKGAHWSEHVTPQRSPLDGGHGAGVDEALAGSLRKLGYTAAAITPKGGIFRGSIDVVSLAKPSEQTTDPRPPAYATRIGQFIDFERSRGDRTGESRWPGYPDSLMGSIAMVRQVLADADWQVVARRTGELSDDTSALDYLAPAPQAGAPQPMPLASPVGAPRFVFDADDELNVLRAIKVAREFNRRAVIVGSGVEFRRLDAITAACAPSSSADGTKPGAWIPLILPLRYPDKPKVGTVGEAASVDLRDLMTWEQAPTNVPRLMKAAPDLAVALTSSKLRDRGKFHEHLRLAIKHGLSEEQALAAITTTPARVLGVEDELGVVAPGRRANLVVTDGEVFKKKTKIRDVWIDGVRHEQADAPAGLKGSFDVEITPPLGAPLPPGGRWELSIDDDNAVTLKQVLPDAPDADAAKPAEGAPAVDKPKDEPKKADKPKPKSAKAKGVSVFENRIQFTLDTADLGGAGVWSLAGVVTRAPNGQPESISGEALMPSGVPARWTATRRADEPKHDSPADKDKADPAAKPEAEAKDDSVSGTWSMTGAGNSLPGGQMPFTMTLKRSSDGAISGTMTAVMGTLNCTGTFDPATGALTLTVTTPDGQAEVTGAAKDDRFTGKGTMGGNTIDITGERTDKPTPGEGDDKKKDDDDDDGRAVIPADLPGYPFGPYALKSPPPQDRVVITNATIWTCGPQGIIENGEIEFDAGRITYVGKARRISGDGVIDAKGKHVTPGIIDCHSHTGISGGVNESGMTITSQVRIGDVTNPDAINWYRQLAGGVTAVSNLHGSANPIGGQNQVNKNRWGARHPDDMHFEGAIPGIKFALGENVKQSNWGDRYTTRYPQTRMGVETMIRDRFIAAREYAKAHADFKSKTFVKEAAPPRRDLQLEALAEILAGERLIHCHSYRQDEILMLGRLAEEFGFKIGTYQHILEGYKVAEVIVKNAIGASAFSDWWAYKVEVQDAIPQAGPIMFEQGIVVSFNSDSDELARRLNVEAGKAVKYSNLPDGTFSVSPEEAFKFVTISPAKQLKIDQRTGSLEEGKDADVVLWSGPPMSTYSRAESTWVDGRNHFSLAQDAAMREHNQRERARLIQKVLGAKKAGDDKADKPESPTKPAPPKPQGVDTPPRSSLVARMLDDAARAREALLMEQVRRGINPDDARPGQCGCED